MLTPTALAAVPIDLVAITGVVGCYFHRHQRRDLVLPYFALNVGVLTVTMTLTSTAVGIGLGLGLFGILSIIRLRSDAITHDEIAYYFIALALGLLAGLRPDPWWVAPALCAVLVAVAVLVDHPRVLPGAHRHLLTVDEAITDDGLLRERVAERLGAEVRHLIVLEVDFVRDLTLVDVRYRRGTPRRHAPGTAARATVPAAQAPLIAAGVR